MGSAKVAWLQLQLANSVAVAKAQGHASCHRAAWWEWRGYPAFASTLGRLLSDAVQARAWDDPNEWPPRFIAGLPAVQYMAY